MPCVICCLTFRFANMLTVVYLLPVAGTSAWLKALGYQLDYDKCSTSFDHGEMRAIGSCFG